MSSVLPVSFTVQKAPAGAEIAAHLLGSARLDRPGELDFVSTDVFDTLLLRTLRSERTRIAMGEDRFALFLARRGIVVASDALIAARLQAQAAAFRAIGVSGLGEVRLGEVIARQLRVLGLPPDLAHERLAIEIEVEKASLKPNRALAAALRAHRAAGARIVAVSDTTLPASAVRELVAHFYGADLIEHVYSSADCGATKRTGELFAIVAQAERRPPELHIGDDLRADVLAARARGVAAHRLARSPLRAHLRRLDGAVAEMKRVRRRRRRVAAAAQPHLQDSGQFGFSVLGPIVVQFCTQIWLYAAEAESNASVALLFCARGGVGIRAAFERVLVKLDLPLAARRENLMISRLVAARAALLARSEAALEELQREFHAARMADVARALGGRAYVLSEAWGAPFTGERFQSLLFGPCGREVLHDIVQQNDRFARHLSAVSGAAERLILCDTGLYGSTPRLLAAGMPQLPLETLQFARCNYKKHGEEHFGKVAGLLVERDCYSPLDQTSCVLRYWHLIESLFEPQLASVRCFSETETGAIAGNCGDIGFAAVDAAAGNALLSGALAYIDALPADRAGLIANSDAELAWARLKQAIVRPNGDDLHCLALAERSVDFGRDGAVQTIGASAADHNLLAKLRGLDAHLWREGAIARAFPVSKRLIFMLLEAAHCVRWLKARRSMRPTT